MTHSSVLFIAYALICLSWWGVSRLLPLWRNPVRPTFRHPWREVGLVFLAILCTLLIGELWRRGFRLTAPGRASVFAEALNQIIIFAPIIAIPFLRRQGSASAWVQPDRPIARIAVGVVLSVIAVGVFVALERGAPSFLTALAEVFSFAHIDEAVQVLLEDLAIAILFVRLAAALGPRSAVAIVALLFAAAHIPALLSGNAVGAEFLGLVRDAALGIVVLGTVWRSGDILWLWPVHFALDMTQFVGKSG